uniref:Uncharacterized protein n=1 Tax=Halomonas sp. 40 TaxID=223901 RepID=A0A090ATZ2_9GAMM|nr:hypothetical protein [Halomonas sp. 40]BAP60114.1 hypothetical protein [Halomonas sp. 40]
MALDRIKDLDQTFKATDGSVVNWRSPQGERYRYERDRAAVGKEIDGAHGRRRYEWHVLDKNDLTTAKRRVFELINEDEL